MRKTSSSHSLSGGSSPEVHWTPPRCVSSTSSGRPCDHHHLSITRPRRGVGPDAAAWQGGLHPGPWRTPTELDLLRTNNLQQTLGWVCSQRGAGARKWPSIMDWRSHSAAHASQHAGAALTPEGPAAAGTQPGVHGCNMKPTRERIVVFSGFQPLKFSAHEHTIYNIYIKQFLTACFWHWSNFTSCMSSLSNDPTCGVMSFTDQQGAQSSRSLCSNHWSQQFFFY